MRRYIARLDKGLINQTRKWPNSLRPFMTSSTVMGDPVVIVFIAVLASLIFFKQNQTKVIWTFLAAIAASALIGILKLCLRRNRPDTKYVSLMRFKSYSFPSGHTFGATVIYGLIAYFLFIYMSPVIAYIGICLILLLILAVGVSRVYLGAHYPSDVLAGWILGLLCLGLIILLIL